MNMLQKTIDKIDNYQQKHAVPGFIYAVIKKYDDDQAGYQAALLTYYGFLSLFPLLLILTTVLGSIANSHPELQQTVVNSITSYFPVLGNQLSVHVHTLHRAGMALLIGLLFTLYGARGVADAFRHGVNSIWQVPRRKQDGFPKSMIKSFGLIVFGGTGFMLASFISTYAAAVAGHGLLFKLLSSLISMFILFWLFLALLKLSLPEHIGIKQTGFGAASAAIGLVILQGFGGYLLARELKSLDALYSSFALALGLLFWIYLQAQVLYYSVEIATVEAHRLWPRSLTGSSPTEADKRATNSNA
jgi:YihY family inner membrane protein